jgi:predicted LPLAT superfamily acyltransferase
MLRGPPRVPARYAQGLEVQGGATPIEWFNFFAV